MCKIILNLVYALYLGNQEGIRIKNVNIRGQLCWQALYRARSTEIGELRFLPQHVARGFGT